MLEPSLARSIHQDVSELIHWLRFRSCKAKVFLNLKAKCLIVRTPKGTDTLLVKRVAKRLTQGKDITIISRDNLRWFECTFKRRQFYWKS